MTVSQALTTLTQVNNTLLHTNLRDLHGGRISAGGYSGVKA